MNILLIDIDSKIPNLALKKIEKYHLDKGDNVTWNSPLEVCISDKIYVSCIFTKNRNKCIEWEDKAEIGGTGYDLYKKLPDEIENIKLKINWGFTSRGCIRKCSFCVVPDKEGMIRPVGDIYDIWDGKNKDIVIMDNNILALKDHFKKICSQIRKEKLCVDFNQGLDLRLLNDEFCQELKTIRHKEYKFAWDLEDENMIEKLEYAYANLKRCTIFVICGFPKDNFDLVKNKFEIIKKIGHNGYAMRHENVYYDKKYIQLARWVNQHHIFQSYTFENFLKNQYGKENKDGRV